MDINEELKREFIEHCEKDWDIKIYKANIINNKKWFYIQVGNYFNGCFHIEYIDLNGKQNLQFHIEFYTLEESEYFRDLLFKLNPWLSYILIEKNMKECKTDKNYLWFDIKDTEKITTKEELFEKISEYMKIFDPAIDLIFFHNFKRPKEVKPIKKWPLVLTSIISILNILGSVALILCFEIFDKEFNAWSLCILSVSLLIFMVLAIFFYRATGKEQKLQAIENIISRINTNDISYDSTETSKSYSEDSKVLSSENIKSATCDSKSKILISAIEAIKDL